MSDAINPERVIRELSPQLPADAQVALDVGSVVYWYARQLVLPPGVPAHVSGTLASMGCSMPFGIAAKLLHPERAVVVLTGDGGFQMTGIAELVTLSRMWRQWPGARFAICVLDNGDLPEVSWEQREMEGAPRFAGSQDLPGFPNADSAKLLGLDAERVTDPDQLTDAWTRALASDRPFLLQVVTDPSIPLLPPFPAGEAKLPQMRSALDAEGAASAAVRRLLDEYAAPEGGHSTGKRSAALPE